MGCHSLLQRNFPNQGNQTHVSYISCMGWWFFITEPLGKPIVGPKCNYSPFEMRSSYFSISKSQRQKVQVPQLTGGQAGPLLLPLLVPIYLPTGDIEPHVLTDLEQIFLENDAPLLNCLLSWLLQFSSVQSPSHVQLFATPGLQHTSLSCPSPTPGAYSNTHPSSWWCHPIISSSVIPFFFCLQSFPASGYFPMSQFFTSGGQRYCSFSFSISPSNEYSGLISFRMNSFYLLAVQGTLKSLLQHHNSKASILQHSASL